MERGYIQVGPHRLKVVSPTTNLAFHTKHPLTPVQKCLVDNLWNSRDKTSFPQILDAMAGHLAFQNSNNPSSSRPLVPQAPNCKLELENLELKVQLNNQKKLIEQLRAELEVKNDFAVEYDKILKEKEEKMLLLPEQLTSISAHILVKICQNKMNDMVQVQELFRNMMTCVTLCPPGISLVLLNDLEGTFSFIKAKLDLELWKDCSILGVSISLESLLEMGFLYEIIINNSLENKKYFYKKHWRLFHIVSTLLKKKNSHVILEIRSTPASYLTGYPDEARTEILIKQAFERKEPVFINQDSGFPLCEDDSQQQLIKARCYMKAFEEEESFFKDFRLVAEERNFKYYCYGYHSSTIYVPFVSHIDEDPKQTYNYLQQHSNQDLDMIFSHVYAANYEEAESPDSPEFLNLQNAMEP